MSCRSKETSLCPSTLLTCGFIVIRKENWDALNPILILFRHLNRVCIIWFMRMGFCLEGKEESVYVCVCVCACVWELCRVLFGFSCFTNIAWESHSYEWKGLLQPVWHSVITYLCFFQWKGETKTSPIFHCSSSETLFLTPVKRTGWPQWEGQGKGGKVLHKQRSSMGIMLVMQKSWNNLAGSKAISNVHVQWT